MKHGYANRGERIDFSSFFKTSLELFRSVKKKHDDELRDKLVAFFINEEYCREQQKKLLELEKLRILRNTQYR